MAGGVIIPYAAKIFKNKTIPDIFKTGILTSVLKNLKDATQMDKYRGSLFTPVITKLFEYALLPTLSQLQTIYIIYLVLQKAALCYYRHYLSQNQRPNVNY